jgi:hypothetical protein
VRLIVAKKDNAGIQHKARMRELLLREIADPVIMETHAGSGHLYRLCYSAYTRGVAFEINKKKAALLASQRPSWAVYNNGCEYALMSGVGFHLPLNFFDLDPYGDPWPVLDALLTNHAVLPDRWGLVVNDGLRRFLMLGCGWKSRTVGEYVAKVGNTHAGEIYPELCRVIMEDKLRPHGMAVTRWLVHSSGHGGQMTHYAAVIEREKSPLEGRGLMLRRLG